MRPRAGGRIECQAGQFEHSQIDAVQTGIYRERNEGPGLPVRLDPEVHGAPGMLPLFADAFFVTVFFRIPSSKPAKV